MTSSLSVPTSPCSLSNKDLLAPAKSPSSFHYSLWRSKQLRQKKQFLVLSTSFEAGGGYLNGDLGFQQATSKTKEEWNEKLDSSQYDALLRGGEQVTSVLQEMITLVGFLLFHRSLFFCCISFLVTDSVKAISLFKISSLFVLSVAFLNLLW